MGRPWKLESFDAEAGYGASLVMLPETRLEEERLQSFDKGYAAGWEDAASAHATQQSNVSQELGENLQQLSFTYHDARQAVLSEMEAILRGVIVKILPRTLQRSLGEMIVERVSDLSDDASEVPVEVVVAPENVARLRSLVADKVAPPLSILEDASLGGGQAYLRMGRSEKKIDLDTVLMEIAEAVADFFETCDSKKVPEYA